MKNLSNPKSLRLVCSNTSDSVNNILLDFINLILEIFVLRFTSLLLCSNQTCERLCQCIQFLLKFLGSNIFEVVEGNLQSVNLGIRSINLSIDSIDFLHEIIVQLCNLFVDESYQFFLNTINEFCIGSFPKWSLCS